MSAAISSIGPSANYRFTGAPSPSSPISLAGTIITPHQSVAQVTISHASGNIYLWYDAPTQKIYINHSAYPSDTFSTPYSIPIPPFDGSHFYATIGLVIAAITLVGTATAIVIVAGVPVAIIGGVAAVVSADGMAAIGFFSLAALSVAAGVLDLAGCNPYCVPNALSNGYLTSGPSKTPPLKN